MDVSETESVPAVLSVSSGWRRAMCHGLPPGFVPMTLIFPPKSRRAFLIPAAFKISAAFSAAVPLPYRPSQGHIRFSGNILLFLRYGKYISCLFYQVLPRARFPSAHDRGHGESPQFGEGREGNVKSTAG